MLFALSRRLISSGRLVAAAGGCAAGTVLAGVRAEAAPATEAAPAPAAAAPAAQLPAKMDRLRVATLNVESLRKEALGPAVATLGPIDVLALQEVRDPQKLQAFATHLNMRVAIVCEADETVGLSNALLLRQDLLEVAVDGPWTLQHHESGRYSESRCAVAVVLPDGIRIVCTHLDHRSEASRLAQLQQLRGHMERAWGAHFAQQPLLLIPRMNPRELDLYRHLLTRDFLPPQNNP